jgi:hypothetical protein
MAISAGEGDDVCAPLGRSGIGGVMTSTLSTMLVIPTFYDILADWRSRVRKSPGFTRGGRTPRSSSVRRRPRRTLKPSGCAAGTLLARRELMPAARPSPLGALTAALLTLALGGTAVVLSKLTGSHAAALLSNISAFIAVGWLMPRLRPGTGVLTTVGGAGSAIVLFGLAQAALFPELREQLGWRVTLESLALSTVFGMTFTTAGATIALARGRHRPLGRAGGHREPASGAAPMRHTTPGRPSR